MLSKAKSTLMNWTLTILALLGTQESRKWDKSASADSMAQLELICSVKQ